MDQQQYFRVQQVAERFDINENKVLAWIGSGELEAVDVSQGKGGRPRWRIHIDAIERFELNRRSIKPIPSRPVRQRKTNIVEYVK